MRVLVIESDKINNFLEEIKMSLDVFDLRYGSELSFKKYFFPPEEIILSGSKMKDCVDNKKFVLFGLKLQDLEALGQLDEIMKTPELDFYYFQKRENSIVIGLIQSAANLPSSSDIVLQKLIDGNYKIWDLTKKGASFLKKYKQFFKDVKKEIAFADESLGEWSDSMREILLDSELLAEAVEWSHNHKIWDELAEKCLGCGVCTYVCPICHCFSMEDKVDLDNKCSRCRKWDACTLPSFSKVAGNHDFRPTIKERYYNWFYHKFVRAYHEFGRSQCVGCGNCKASCPAGIDIQEVLNKIVADYKNREKQKDKEKNRE